MKRQELLVFILLTVCRISVQAQISSEPALLENVTAEKIYADLYGNVYAVQDFTLKKFDYNGKLTETYGDFHRGTITSVDVTNPQKILVYHGDAGIIEIVDEHLFPIVQPLELYNSTYRTIDAVCLSTSNRIWMFDETNADLIQIDFQLNETQKLHFGSKIQPQQLFEIAERQVVLNAGNDGILFFDAFGTLLKQISIFSSDIQIVNDNIIYLKDNELHIYNFKMLAEETLDIPVNNLRQAVWNRERIILLTMEGKIQIINTKEFTK